MTNIYIEEMRDTLALKNYASGTQALYIVNSAPNPRINSEYSTH